MAADVVLGDVADPAAQAVLAAGLNAFNDAAMGFSDRLPLTVLVRDGGAVVGGAIGRTSLGVLFLEQFFLPEALRGGGLGSDVLRRFEAEGVRRGCGMGVVNTLSFQAPGFYERHGWERFGEVGNVPAGSSRIWLRKVLAR